MKTFLLSCGLLILTVWFLFVLLDNGAVEANLGIFVAPVNALCGLALCRLAFRQRLQWVGILGLVMLAIWPFFTLALAVQVKGIFRQLMVGGLAATYALSGLWCFYNVFRKEWKALRHSHNH